MTKNIKLSYKDIKDIIEENNDNFEVLYNDIPKEGHSSLYIEDDGRQLRYFEFKSKETGDIYHFSYVYHPEFGFDLPYCLLSKIENVTIIKDIPKEPLNNKAPKELTEFEKKDKDLWESYLKTEVFDYTTIKDTIPVSVVEDIIQFLNTEKFSIFELRMKLIPICIQYKVEQKSFWKAIQKMRGVWH